MLCNVLLVSAAQCSKPAVSVHTSPPSWTFSPLPSPIQASWGDHELPPVLCSSFPLAIHFTRGSVYMSIPTIQCPTSLVCWLNTLSKKVSLREEYEGRNENMLPLLQHTHTKGKKEKKYALAHPLFPLLGFSLIQPFRLVCRVRQFPPFPETDSRCLS